MIAEKNEIGPLGPHDVLLGRGTGPNESIGNIRFRTIVRVIIEDSGIRNLDRLTKAILAKLIIARIKEKGGRFLKKVNPGSKDINAAKGEKTIEGLYEEVSDLVTSDKVKQTLRHYFRTLRPRHMSRSIPSTRDVSAEKLMVRPSSSQPSAPPQYRLSPPVGGSWPTSALLCTLSNTPHILLPTLSPGVDAYLKSTTADFQLAHMADALQVRYDHGTTGALVDRLNDHLATAIAPVPAVPPLIAKDNIALQLLKRQELALLRDSLVRQCDEQNYMLSTHQFLLPSLETSSGIALLLHLRSRLASETILDTMPLL
jgi:hypothetical protein